VVKRTCTSKLSTMLGTQRKGPVSGALIQRVCLARLEGDLDSQAQNARPAGELFLVQETGTNSVNVRVGLAERIVRGINERINTCLKHVRLRQRIVPVVENVVRRDAQRQVDPLSYLSVLFNSHVPQVHPG